MPMTPEEDGNLDLVEISVVDDRYLAEICVKALRDQKYHATMESKSNSGGLPGFLGAVLGGLMGRSGGSQSILVPAFQADEARAYLEGSRLLGPAK